MSNTEDSKDKLLKNILTFKILENLCEFNEELFEIAIECANENVLNENFKNKRNLLFVSCVHSSNAVKLLLNSDKFTNENINWKSCDGFTAMHQKINTNALEILLKSNKFTDESINSCDVFGRTIIFYQKNAKNIELLLKSSRVNDETINKIDHFGNNLLYDVIHSHEITNEDIAIVELLLNNDRFTQSSVELKITYKNSTLTILDYVCSCSLFLQSIEKFNTNKYFDLLNVILNSDKITTNFVSQHTFNNKNVSYNYNLVNHVKNHYKYSNCQKIK